MGSTPSTYNESYCYRWGEGGRALYVLSQWLPFWLFVEFASRARAGHPTQRTYYAVHGKFFLYVWLLYYVCRDEVFRHAVPYPGCTTQSFSMPTIGSFITTCFVALALAHKFYFSAPWGSWWWTALVFFITVGSEVVSGNYSVFDMGVGIGLGLFVAALLIYLLYVELFPAQVFLHGTWWLWWHHTDGYYYRYNKERCECGQGPDKILYGEVVMYDPPLWSEEWAISP